MQNLKKILFLLSSQERKHAALLMVMIIIMAFLDMIGVASILPFMAVVTNPSIIETNLILNIMYQASSIFGAENNQQFLFVLGVLVFVLLIISLTFKAFTTPVSIASFPGLFRFLVWDTSFVVGVGSAFLLFLSPSFL